MLQLEYNPTREPFGQLGAFLLYSLFGNVMTNDLINLIRSLLISLAYLATCLFFIGCTHSCLIVSSYDWFNVLRHRRVMRKRLEYEAQELCKVTLQYLKLN